MGALGRKRKIKCGRRDVLALLEELSQNPVNKGKVWEGKKDPF